MKRLDLRTIVPEPPDELLTMAAIEINIQRWRRRRTVAAASAMAIVIGGTAVALGASFGPDTTSVQPGPISHRDGRLLFTKDTAGTTRYFRNSSLFSLTPTGDEAHRVTHQSGEIIETAAAPDGRRVAYAQDTYGIKHNHRYVNGENVHVANADGSHDRSVYHCPNSACGQLIWSPTSDRLLITAEQSQILQPSGRLTPVCIGGCPGDSIEGASWSPNGRQIAFQWSKTVALSENQRSAAAAIGVMNADGSDPHLITDLGCTGSDRGLCTDDTDPQWSTAGSTIAFLRVPHARLLPEGDIGGLPPGPAEIESVRADGSHLTQLANCGGNCSIRGLSWSPSGDRVAYLSNRLPAGARKETESLHLAVVGSGRGYREDLPFLSGGMRVQFTWSPSGSRIAIAGREDVGAPSGVWVLPVDRHRLGTPTRISLMGYQPLTWLAAPAD